MLQDLLMYSSKSNKLRSNFIWFWVLLKDKDLELIFSQLPQDATYYFCAPNIGRAEEVSVLMKLAENIH